MDPGCTLGGLGMSLSISTSPLKEPFKGNLGFPRKFRQSLVQEALELAGRETVALALELSGHILDAVTGLFRKPYLESQWPIIMGYVQSIMGYFGV